MTCSRKQTVADDQALFNRHSILTFSCDRSCLRTQELRRRADVYYAYSHIHAYIQAPSGWFLR